METANLALPRTDLLTVLARLYRVHGDLEGLIGLVCAEGERLLAHSDSLLIVHAHGRGGGVHVHGYLREVGEPQDAPCF